MVSQTRGTGSSAQQKTKAKGKATKASTFKKNAIPPSPQVSALTPEEEKTIRILAEKKKKSQQDAKKAADQESRQINASMREDDTQSSDDSDSDQNQNPKTKRKASSSQREVSAPAKKKQRGSNILSDEEIDLAANLSGQDQINSNDEDDTESLAGSIGNEHSEVSGEADSQDDEDKEQPEEQVDEEREEEEEETPSRALTNELFQNGIYTQKPPNSKQGRTRRRSRKSGDTESDRPRSGKVLEGDFDKDVLRLATAAKAYFRQQAALEEAYPSKDATERSRQGMSLLKRAAKSDISTIKPSLTAIFKRLASSEETTTLEAVLTYAAYGRGNLTSGLAMKTSELITGYYKIGGKFADKDNIQKKVKWLTTAGHFKFGELNIDEETHNKNLPFSHPIITHVIRLQWFGKSRSDHGAYNAMVTAKRIFPRVIILAVTCIENCLKCWAAGYKSNIPFSEDNCSDRYAHHANAYKVIQERCPSYAQNLEASMYTKISLQIAMGGGIESPEEEFEGIDLDFLEESARASLNARGAVVSAGASPPAVAPPVSAPSSTVTPPLSTPFSTVAPHLSAPFSLP